MPDILPPPSRPPSHHEQDDQPLTTTTNTDNPLPLPPSLRWSSPAVNSQSFYSPSPSQSTPFYSPVSRTPCSSGRPSPIPIPNPTISAFRTLITMKRNGPPNNANIILQEPGRTHPLIWGGAVLCLVLILLIIIFAISTLIMFLVINPKHPRFDIPNANLNAIYFDTPDLFNGDFTLLANFTNPNKKINLRFKSVDLDLVFSDRVISSQWIPPFDLKKGGRVGRWEVVRMVSSLVKLPHDAAGELQKKVESGRVEYAVNGKFRVEATVAAVGKWCKFSYWQRVRCQLVVTAPPSGVLVARSCST